MKVYVTIGWENEVANIFLKKADAEEYAEAFKLGVEEWEVLDRVPALREFWSAQIYWEFGDERTHRHVIEEGEKMPKMETTRYDTRFKPPWATMTTVTAWGDTEAEALDKARAEMARWRDEDKDAGQ